MLETARSRLATYPWHTLELGLTVMLWQASTGVFLLSLVQQYLPQQLEANAAWGPVAPFKMGAIMLVLALLLTVMHLRHQRRAEAAVAAVRASD